MKKIRICLAAAILALGLLSGCGMYSDGYIEDDRSAAKTPIESPVIPDMPTASPNVDGDRDTGKDTGKNDGMSGEKTPAPSASPEIER